MTDTESIVKKILGKGSGVARDLTSKNNVVTGSTTPDEAERLLFEVAKYKKRKR